MFTYIIDSIYLLLLLILFFLVQVRKHCMLITSLVLYNAYQFWNNFKNNLRTLSGWFLTKHPLTRTRSAGIPKLMFLYAGVYCSLGVYLLMMEIDNIFEISLFNIKLISFKTVAFSLFVKEFYGIYSSTLFKWCTIHGYPVYIG